MDGTQCIEVTVDDGNVPVEVRNRKLVLGWIGGDPCDKCARIARRTTRSPM